MTFATLRCTNNSPGNSPTISFAGTLLSEQPIQRNSGDCWATSFLKNSGSLEIILFAQSLLLDKS